MSVEIVGYEFLKEQTLKEHIKTLQDISSKNYAPIQCDQGSTENYRIVNACDYAVKLIKKELDTMLSEKEMLYAELDTKYGKGKYVVDMAGGVHLTKMVKDV